MAGQCEQMYLYYCSVISVMVIVDGGLLCILKDTEIRETKIIT